MSATFKLTKAHRLTKAAEFGEVFDKNQHKASSRHVLLLAKGTDHGNARLGLVISKKNAGKAVFRNRVKRLSREVFRNRCSELPSIDLVVLAKPGVSALSNQNLITLLHQLFDKLQLSFARSTSGSTIQPSSGPPNLPND